MRAFLLSLLILLALGLFAQAQGYAVGDRVIFDYYQTPTEGEILAHKGNQYLIRFKTAFGDSQAYYDASVVLRRAGQPAPAPAAKEPVPAAKDPVPAAKDPAPGGGAGVGQKVLFNYHGDWKEGEVIGKNGKQILIRHQTDFGPAQAYYSPEDVKPLGAGLPAAANPAAVQPAKAENPKPAPQQPAPNPGGGGGLMTEAEVLGFLKGRLGDNPWAPNRAQVLGELAQQVKSRGMAYHYSSENPLYQEISKFGMGSDLTAPLDDNYGPPPKRGSLLGTWATEVNAPPVYFEKNNELWRHNDKVEKTGSLTINGGGTYSWKLSSGAVVNGTWRAATETEMKTAGGEGLVLNQGRGGWDWIVTKYREPGPPNMSQNWITIAELTTRQEREFGNR